MINTYGLDTDHDIHVGKHLYLESVRPVTVTDIRGGWVQYVSGHVSIDWCVPDALAPHRRVTPDHQPADHDTGLEEAR
ncbi:hypothetical protein [Nocardia transvalensis]|uniref:hypothetical protein n=1 Tax=Nocardia transvalensis TaxID=37333 RepID=UPI001893045C|nr:hypothetical protein [Nocardia transvalensis]MBF6333504.1 hypothetical protein [Nocardia transvalensis]